jgi:hypothetical protein
LLSCTAISARAAELPCGPSEPGTTELDGLTSDWSDIEGLEAGGRDENRSFTVKCTVEDEQLFLLVDVRDNYFVRTPAAAPGEDHLNLRLGSKTLRLFPGDAAKLHTKVAPADKGLQVQTALQEHGFAVELAVPLSRIGFRNGSPQLPFEVTFADCDSKATCKTEGTVTLSGQIVFPEGASHFETYLKQQKLKPSDVFWDQPITLGHGGGRVLLAGHQLALITNGYLFIELPFRDRKDLRDVRLIDLAGDGRQAVVMRYLERSDRGTREVLTVYRPAGDTEWRRAFAAEVQKSVGASRLENKVSFVKRGKATDIVLEPRPPIGFSQATYREEEERDLVPILLPWGPDKKAVYQFRGDEYLRK